MARSKPGDGANRRRTHEHHVSTTASESTCHHCGAATLDAYDEGLHVKVDGAPIGFAGSPASVAAELAALVAGAQTYVRTRGGDLVHRTAERISLGRPSGTIHRQHQCGAA